MPQLTWSSPHSSREAMTTEARVSLLTGTAVWVWEIIVLYTERYFITTQSMVDAIHSMQSTFIHILLFLDSVNPTRLRQQTNLFEGFPNSCERQNYAGGMLLLCTERNN